MRENLALAAQMRLSFSMREKFERIEQVMNEVHNITTITGISNKHTVLIHLLY